MEEDKARIIKIIVSAVLLAAAFATEKFCNLATWQLLLVYLVPYLIVGWETLEEGAEAALHGEGLNEDFLMGVATLGALAIGFLPGAEAQFPEAVAVMLFFQIGKAFEDAAEDRSRRSISALMDIRPDKALVEKDGGTVEVASESVEPGDVIVVRPGARIPMDGIVLEGESSLDTSALTGESLPRSIGPEDEAVSGCINLSAVLRIRVTKAFGESTAARILRLVEDAAENKGRSENFITRFAKVYTPVVVAMAVALAVLPPMLGLVFGFEAGWAKWIYRALTFLVVSCPCALVISIPLTFFAGIGGASRKGILIKGSNWMETLSRADTVVFDKTGTLTKGVFEVTAVHPEVVSERELLHIAAHVERASTHPIAQSLRNAYPEEDDDCKVRDIKEMAGLGARALVNGREVCVGNGKLMDSVGAKWHDCHKAGTVVHVSMDGEYMGHIVISDKLKDDAAEAVAALGKLGVGRTVMLTGDAEAVAREVASETGIGEYYAGLMPADKVEKVSSVIAGHDRQSPKTLAFVGDGINDAPVLARADIGIAMGALGSDAAIEAADVVLMDDKPSKIALAIRICRRTVRIARENAVFAIGIKLAVLLLAALGIASMMLAVFADVGVMVLAVLNAARALKA
ncbi:MAG: cadmium-translocating P-type ATPase [Bacteroidales bacterium]|nr:cadmium-translocating P-type ATPase [Bacteroidales bacterium]